MFDSSFITYAISLHFPQNVNDIITSAVKSISEITGNHFITENNIPPHLTIGAFHSKKETEAKLIHMIKEFLVSQKHGIVKFNEIGNFNGKVLFLKPEKNSFLLQINTALQSALLPEFKEAQNGYYLPKIWFPHTTLASRLNQSQLKNALSVAEKIKLPLETEINEISVYMCSPFVEIKRFFFNS